MPKGPEGEQPIAPVIGPTIIDLFATGETDRNQGKETASEPSQRVNAYRIRAPSRTTPKAR